MASAPLSPRAMAPIKTCGTRLEAGLVSLRLRAERIMGTVVGIGLAMEGGTEGVRLLVPDDQVDRDRGSRRSVAARPRRPRRHRARRAQTKARR
jgi:hypothetical protein